MGLYKNPARASEEKCGKGSQEMYWTVATRSQRVAGAKKGPLRLFDGEQGRESRIG